MKAVISSRIYIKASEELQQYLKSELTYTLDQFNRGNREPIIVKNCMQVTPDIVSIPSGRLDLVPKDYKLVDKRVCDKVEFPEFKFKLRASQQEVYEAVDSSCIINAAPSWGKTFCGIAIAAKLGLKTLIVTHTLALRAQWEREIEKTLGIIPGVIGSGKFQTDAIIVVANVQTLVKHYDKVADMFGTIIIDECHHAPASMFTKIVNSSKAKFKIGLSATLERKDGMHVVLQDYFSSKLFRPKRENMLIPTIYRVPTDVPFSDNSGTPWAHRVNELFGRSDFTNMIITAAATQAARGHKVLVVSDRVFFLEHCHEILEDNSICITGQVKPEERDTIIQRIFEDVDIIFGTTSIFAEGVNIPPLSCLILTTPVNNDSLLEQLIGRIVRLYPGKKTPEVIDWLLQGATAKRQAQTRLGLYIKRGYDIKELQAISNKFEV